MSFNRASSVVEGVVEVGDVVVVSIGGQISGIWLFNSNTSPLFPAIAFMHGLSINQIVLCQIVQIGEQVVFRRVEGRMIGSRSIPALFWTQTNRRRESPNRCSREAKLGDLDISKQLRSVDLQSFHVWEVTFKAFGDLLKFHFVHVKTQNIFVTHWIDVIARNLQRVVIKGYLRVASVTRCYYRDRPHAKLEFMYTQMLRRKQEKRRFEWWTAFGSLKSFWIDRN